MSWRDRDYSDDPRDRMGRPGGDWQGVRPRFDNPMTWSVTLVRVFGITIRLHLIFLIFVIVQLARSLASDAPLGFTLVAIEMLCLFWIVLLHEFGHCFACRWMRGEADEILMWPLGGLAFCRPPHRWLGHLVTAIGGPMVNVAIFLVLAPLLGVLTGQWLGVAIPNPLAITLPLLPDGRQPMWLVAIYLAHYTSMIILLFNLLPVFPLDGGRIVQASLWPRFGYVQSMRLAVYTGYVGAIGLLILALVVQDMMLGFIAVFGGITCYVTIKQLEWTETFMGEQDDLFAQSLWGGDEPEPTAEESGPGWAERRAAKRAAIEAEESREIDRILAKIAAEGLDRLTVRERRLLKKATQRRQQEDG